MLASFPEITRADMEGKQILVLNYEYGKNFSGPGKDTFDYKRAVGEAKDAHKSNFLHPVFYFYQSLPTGRILSSIINMSKYGYNVSFFFKDKDMSSKGQKDVLPIPDYVHHIVEDFLTDFTAPTMHLLPLRRFLEHILQSDIRKYDSTACLRQMMTSVTVPMSCNGPNIMM